ncbi:MAG: PhoU domain-containing protein [Acidilobaceae archaeon]
MSKRFKGESLRDILINLKYYSSIAVDLAMYSLAFRDNLAAIEVLKMEETIDDLYKEAIAKLIIAFRSTTYLQQALGLISIASSLDTISDAAGDIASVVLRGYPTHAYITAIMCHGEAVGLVKSRKHYKGVPARVDVLLLKRGDRYEIAPRTESILEDDVIVVRGPIEEVLEVARTLGEESLSKEKCGLEVSMQALGGDALALTLLSLKAISRSMLDLAFYSLLSNDKSIADTVAEMEVYADKLYHELLEHLFTTSYPGRSSEMVSLAVLTKSLEEISDAALRISNVIRYGQYAQVMSHVVSEGEEAYTRVKFKLREPLSLRGLGLEDRGFIPIAIYREGDWIAPVSSDVQIKSEDEIILKYYRVGEEIRILEELRERGLEPIR